jgi:hypothetical protein
MILSQQLAKGNDIKALNKAYIIGQTLILSHLRLLSCQNQTFTYLSAAA